VERERERKKERAREREFYLVEISINDLGAEIPKLGYQLQEHLKDMLLQNR